MVRRQNTSRQKKFFIKDGVDDREIKMIDFPQKK